MTKYRKKPVVVEAKQWNQHGDHPEVSAYYNQTQRPCNLCGDSLAIHGWVETLQHTKLWRSR